MLAVQCAQNIEAPEQAACRGWQDLAHTVAGVIARLKHHHRELRKAHPQSERRGAAGRTAAEHHDIEGVSHSLIHLHGIKGGDDSRW